MVNKRVLAAKCSAIEHHLARIIEKRQIDLQVLLTDLDRQESILFNLQMAIQNCIDRRPIWSAKKNSALRAAPTSYFTFSKRKLSLITARNLS